MGRHLDYKTQKQARNGKYQPLFTLSESKHMDYKTQKQTRTGRFSHYTFGVQTNGLQNTETN